jgi:death on curing protein
VSELVWIDEREALALRNRLLALYGGAPGLRDVGLLQSASATPR